jgi:hypothetical protein
MVFVAERRQHPPTLKVDVVGLEVVAEACRDDARREIEQISDRIVEVVIGTFRGQRLRAPFSSTRLTCDGIGSGHDRVRQVRFEPE